MLPSQNRGIKLDRRRVGARGLRGDEHDGSGGHSAVVPTVSWTSSLGDWTAQRDGPYLR